MFNWLKRKKKNVRTSTLGLSTTQQLPKMFLREIVGGLDVPLVKSTLRCLQPYVDEFTSTHEPIYDYPFWSHGDGKMDLWTPEDISGFVEGNKKLIRLCAEVCAINNSMAAVTDLSAHTFDERLAYCEQELSPEDTKRLSELA